jgi:phage tail sheath protein FI
MVTRVYVEEIANRSPSIAGADTSTAAFVDCFAAGPFDTPTHVASFAEFEAVFGGLAETSEASYGIRQLFLNGGRDALVVRVHGNARGAITSAAQLLGSAKRKTGLYALDRLPRSAFSLLCLPAAVRLRSAAALVAKATAFCEARRALFLVDVPPGTARSRNLVAYAPQLRLPDRDRVVGPSGTMAGVYAQVDLWKPPTGIRLAGVSPVADVRDTGDGINAIRDVVGRGTVPWGARTLASEPEWKYVSVRRLGLYLERSIDEGLQWAVFEPNGEALWGRIRQDVANFLTTLWRQGGLMGAKQEQAFFVRCGPDTITPVDLAAGVVNVLVGFAPVRPAEFVLLRFRLRAGG